MGNLHCLTLALSFVASATAHGGVVSYTIDGKEYGANPYRFGEMISNGDTNSPSYNLPDLAAPSIQRPYYWFPIEDPLSANISCNYNDISNAPSLHAPVPAGGNVTAFWASSGSDPVFPYYWTWRHMNGPMLTYLARCPGDSCANFDPTSQAVWFKIAQIGLAPGATNMQEDGTWLQWKIANAGWTVQIPEGLKSGAYLIRHEILMLAGNPAQFYPNCAQIMVTGEGEKEPKTEELVAFPGAYQASDPGIVLADWLMGSMPLQPQWNTSNYIFPGPPVWNGTS